MNPFQDKVAIITGGAAGIGLALGNELGRRGAAVVLADIDGQEARRAATIMAGWGGRAESADLDVADAGQVAEVVQGTIGRHGRLDYFFNNAGTAVVGEFRDTTPEHWKRVIDVNLLGVVYGSMAAYAAMIRQGFGHIVNISSMVGLVPSPVMTPYATTKTAVNGFTAALRLEAAGLGVKVTGVCPGLVRTNIAERINYLRVSKEAYLARLPWRLMMEPGQAARVILRGVERNRAMVVCPFYARVLWWVQRHLPALLTPLWRKSVREWRAMRTGD